MSVGDADSIVASSSFSFYTIVLPDLGVVERGDECVRRALDQINDRASVGSRPDCEIEADDEDEDTFVVFVGDVHGEGGVESDGFTFSDALMWENWATETIFEEVVDASEVPAS